MTRPNWGVAGGGKPLAVMAAMVRAPTNSFDFQFGLAFKVVSSYSCWMPKTGDAEGVFLQVISSTAAGPAEQHFAPQSHCPSRSREFRPAASFPERRTHPSAGTAAWGHRTSLQSRYKSR